MLFRVQQHLKFEDNYNEPYTKDVEQYEFIICGSTEYFCFFRRAFQTGRGEDSIKGSTKGHWHMNVKGKVRHGFKLDVNIGKCRLEWYDKLEASKWFT